MRKCASSEINFFFFLDNAKMLENKLIYFSSYSDLFLDLEKKNCHSRYIK